MSIDTVVIHQPDFFPYLGFFHRFLNADFYISLDHVQFSPAWTARDKIKTQNGWKWLTVNVKKTPQKTSILQKEIWGYGQDLETHTVETHIYRLRKKIKDYFNDATFLKKNKNGYLL